MNINSLTRNARILLLLPVLTASCKRPAPVAESRVPAWEPNFAYAAFFKKVTEECTKGKSAIAEFSNPGFTEIVQSSDYMHFMKDDFPSLSMIIKSKIEGEAPQEDGRRSKVYFIKNHTTIVFEMEAGELPCSFGSHKDTLGPSIYAANRQALR